MSKHVAYLSIAAALLAGNGRPAAAADLYGYEGGGPPLAYHSRDDVFVEGGRARIVRSEDLRPAGYYGRGPVVFDERGPDRGFGGGYGPPYGDGGPAGYPPPPPPPAFRYGYGPGPVYRPAGFAGPAYGHGYGGPDGGCTTEQARSVTPAGWRKIVTYRTCYRR